MCKVVLYTCSYTKHFLCDKLKMPDHTCILANIWDNFIHVHVPCYLWLVFSGSVLKEKVSWFIYLFHNQWPPTFKQELPYLMLLRIKPTKQWIFQSGMLYMYLHGGPCLFESWQIDTQQSIFDELWGASKYGQTWSFWVFDISLNRN